MVYVVFIQDDFGEASSVHSVHSSLESAEKEASELSSRLHEMTATVESHEVQE